MRIARREEKKDASRQLMKVQSLSHSPWPFFFSVKRINVHMHYARVGASRGTIFVWKKLLKQHLSGACESRGGEDELRAVGFGILPLSSLPFYLFFASSFLSLSLSLPCSFSTSGLGFTHKPQLQLSLLAWDMRPCRRRKKVRRESRSLKKVILKGLFECATGVKCKASHLHAREQQLSSNM